MNQTLRNIVLIFLGAFAVLWVVADYGDKEYRKAPAKMQSLEELKAWAQTEIIQEYCKDYARVRAINNETKRQRELSEVNNYRYDLVPYKIRKVVEDNDLPDSYADDLFHYVDKEIDKCE
jgi:hypothetical protein